MGLVAIPAILQAQTDPPFKISPRLWDLTFPEVEASSSALPGIIPVGGEIVVSNARVPTEGDTVIISAIAESDPALLAAELTALGLEHAAVAGRVVSGRLPIGAIPSLSQLASLRFARPSLAVANIGATTSQGDVALKSDTARTTYGKSGAGVTVGILSDSFANLPNGWANGVASGDLPSGIIILKDYTPPPGGALGTDEGRAMAEIVADVAPGSGIKFHTAWYGDADFANGIRALWNAGCQVIVDDVIILEEPMFADGVIAQAVNEVAAAGASYFSAAGNAAAQSYVSAFRDCGGTEAGYHNFLTTQPGDASLNISLNLGRVWFVLQWKDRYASTGLGNQGAETDLDLEVRIFTNTQRTTLLATYTSGVGNVGSDPVDTLGINVGNGWGIPAEIRIKHKSGPLPEVVKVVWYTTGILGQQEYVTANSTLYGHMNAWGASAVGAARYCNTPAFGKTPPTLEAFSARGGTPIYFLPDNTPTYELRPKPDFVAPQGGNTTFFGSDTDGCGSVDAFRNFYGTSAAAPHAAGLAALMLQARPGTSPDRIRTVLKATAVDMGTTGFDYDSGWGLIQADATLARQTLPGPVLQALYSRKAHVNRTDFDLSLPLSGKPGVEGRNSTNYKLVFRFDRQITGARAAVTAGVGAVSGPVVCTGTDVVVALSGVSNAQWLTVTVSEITAGDGSYAVSTTGRVGVLAGDVDGDGRVVSTDVLKVRQLTGAVAVATTFRCDVDLTGVINSTDYLMTRQWTGYSLPAW
jgi:hypothetical protein